MYYRVRIKRIDLNVSSDLNGDKTDLHPPNSYLSYKQGG